MDTSSTIAGIRRALTSLVPLPVKVSVHSRINNARLARIVRAKKRFRAARAAGRVATTAQPGVNLIAYMRAEMGLGVVSRGMAAALEVANVPFNVLNIESGTFSRHTDYSWKHKEVSRSDYDTTIVFMNPDQSLHLRSQVPATTLGDRYVIANWYWELPELPDEWLKDFEFVDEVWVASQFIADAVSQKAPVPVVRMPPVVLLSRDTGLSRKQLGLPENCYLFLAMLDTNSVLQRKNPLGVLRAFKAAFDASDASVGLVMKFNDPDYREPTLQRVREEVAGWQNVFVIDRIMNRAEVSSLINACDCFVSLHRSEGFGLGPAEAMSLGKPAIITNWSGCVDYMTADNSIAIDYELVKLGRDYGPYKAHQQWAEPDVEQASYWMKKLAGDPELGLRLGQNGQQTIAKLYSPQAVGQKIRTRLEQIR
ncbi:MAG TPA: glycosyltransferase [Pyrinomonadaceae bacterium]|nr:glycosyltransferase [Pyrinomonadaceae bacterium]